MLMQRRTRWAVGLLTAAFVVLVVMQLKCPKFFYWCCSFRYARYFDPDIEVKSRTASLRLATHPNLRRLNSPSPDLVIAIVTVYRPLVRHQYFHLTLWSLLSEFGREDAGWRLRVIACNSEYNSTRLPGYLTILRRHLTIRHRPLPPEEDVFDKEREDYVFCMQEALRTAPTARHIVMLEDDAPVRRGGSPFFPTLRHFISQAERRGRRFAYLKLYHPPRLLGFIQPEWDRHLEAWAIVAIVTTALFALSECGCRIRALNAFVRQWRLAVFCFLLAVYSLDRHWVLELRSRFVHTHLLVPATFCCTPGMVFQRSGATDGVAFMSKARCDKDYKKDALLFDFYSSSGLPAWHIQPNLLEHVGKESTLHSEGVKTINL